ncbi:MAG: 4-hydroxybenzoate octaprenyltransferase [Magnetococcales bacterium]|nr:4-hydroxybenzoate octaprenyltransferase [Magnetococcales bacterium]
MSHWVDRLPSASLREFLRLMRVDRPIGTWLVLWPALWSLWAAAKPALPAGELVCIITLGSFLMRSAGCVINDLADRNFDPLVARTRERPLAARRISVRAAKGLLLGLLAVSLLLALQLNLLALQLSAVGALLAATYPFTKRFITWPQFYLGAAFGWGVMVAWGAAAENLPGEAWLLFIATLTWTAGYDTVYALMDIEDDLRIGVKSTAILFGRFALPIVAMLYLLTLLLLAVVGWRMGFNLVFYAVLWGAGGQMVWQMVLVRNGHYLRAFLSNKWLGAWIWLGVVLG